MYVCMYVCIHMDTSARVKLAGYDRERCFRFQSYISYTGACSLRSYFQSLWPLFSNRFGRKVDIPSFSDSPRCPVLGFSRCLAVGSRVLVLGSWSLVWGSSLVLGSEFLVLAAGFVPGSWFMVLGFWFEVPGYFLFPVLGPWFVVPGPGRKQRSLPRTRATITAAIDVHQ